MHIEKTFSPKDLFAVRTTPQAELFSLGIKAAIGHQLLRQEPAAFEVSKSRCTMAFYMCERTLQGLDPLVSRAPRIVLKLVGNEESSTGRAYAEIEVEYAVFRHPGQDITNPLHCSVSGTFVVNFPDAILGMENLISMGRSSSAYRGLYFNLTPGELQGNLFDLFNFVSRAFSLTFQAMRDQAEVELGRTPSAPALLAA